MNDFEKLVYHKMSSTGTQRPTKYLCYIMHMNVLYMLMYKIV